MSRYLLRLTVFVALSIVVILGIDVAVSRGLRRTTQGELGVWNDIYSGRIECEVAIVGSSRAHRHFSTKIIGDRLNQTIYNLGHVGHHFPLQHVRFNAFLEHNPHPEIVIQSLDLTSLHDRATVFQYEQFLPHFNRPEIVRAMEKYEGYDNRDALLPMFRYRGRTRLVREGLDYMFRDLSIPSDRDRGYQPADKQWDGAFDQFKDKNRHGFEIPIDMNVLAMIDEFIAQCVGLGCQTIMVYSPEYKPGQSLCTNRGKLVALLKEIANKHGVLLLDYSDHAICNDRTLFFNSQHMNVRGAEKFSRVLADDLIKLLSRPLYSGEASKT